MEANNGKGNIPSRDIWQTPQQLFNQLNDQYNFKFDCCATEDNKKCDLYSDNFESVKIMKETSWLNPPFSISYCIFEHFFKVIKRGVAIYRCDNLETALWQKVIFPNCSWIFIPNKRISYEGIAGSGARFPSALIGLNIEIPKLLNGVILEVKKQS